MGVTVKHSSMVVGSPEVKEVYWGGNWEGFVVKEVGFEPGVKKWLNDESK